MQNIKNLPQNIVITTIRNFYIAILWAIIIAILSLIAGNNVNKITALDFRFADKLAHFIMYFIFSFLLMHGYFLRLNMKSNAFKLNIYLYALLISVIFGGCMEFLQIIINTNRAAELLDFVANTLGSLLALFSFNKIHNMFKSILLKFTI